jgi:hypothetical protein
MLLVVQVELLRFLLQDSIYAIINKKEMNINGTAKQPTQMKM